MLASFGTTRKIRGSVLEAGTAEAQFQFTGSSFPFQLFSARHFTRCLLSKLDSKTGLLGFDGNSYSQFPFYLVILSFFLKPPATSAYDRTTISSSFYYKKRSPSFLTRFRRLLQLFSFAHQLASFTCF